MTLEKAKLFEIIDWSETNFKVSPKPQMEVQFNPASLKVSYSNQVQADGNNTSSAIQSVGKGDSKLAVELLFDVSGAGAEGIGDVREMTKKVAYFMKTKPAEASGSESATGDQPPQQQSQSQAQQQQRFRVPGLRFQWGSFYFDGILVSMDETLDLWSENGRPLRATVAMNLSQPGIHFPDPTNPKATGSPSGASQAGITPFSAATQGATLQGMVAGAGIKADWKAVAALNGIENPRNLTPGTLVNFKVGANVSAGARVNTSTSGSASANLQAGGGFNT